MSIRKLRGKMPLSKVVAKSDPTKSPSWERDGPDRGFTHGVQEILNRFVYDSINSHYYYA